MDRDYTRLIWEIFIDYAKEFKDLIDKRLKNEITDVEFLFLESQLPLKIREANESI